MMNLHFVRASLTLMLLSRVSILNTYPQDTDIHYITESDWTVVEKELKEFWRNGSVEDRCFKRTRRWNRTKRCSCDDSCWQYGDCCLDKAKAFWLKKNETHINFQWTCEDLPPTTNNEEIENAYMVSKCPPGYDNDDVKIMCQRNAPFENYPFIQDVPVVSTSSNIIYVNVFCAICHNDTTLYREEIVFSCNLTLPSYEFLNSSNYLPGRRLWTMHENTEPKREQMCYFSLDFGKYNWKRFIRKGSRSCLKSTSICPVLRNSNASLLFSNTMCSAFVNLVRVKQSSFNKERQVFKNFYCAICNKVKTQDLDNSYSPTITKNKDLKPMELISKHSYSESINFSTVIDNCNKGELFITGDCISKATNDYFLCQLFRCKQPMLADTEDFSGNFTESEININASTSFSVNDSFPKRQNETCETCYYTRRISILSISLISSICLFIYILLHLTVPSLRPQKSDNLVPVISLMLVEQILFILARTFDYRNICEITAIAINFCSIAILAWINVSSVKTLSSLSTLGDKKLYKKHYSRQYSTYLWVLPGILILLGITLSQSAFIYDIVLLSPFPTCWLPEHRSYLIYVNLPVAYFLLGNATFLVLTARLIYCSKHGNEFVQHKLAKDQFLFNFNLLLLKGLTWFLSYLGNLEESVDIWYASVILNSVHGLVILAAVMIRRFLRRHPFIERIPASFWRRRLSIYLERTRSTTSKTIPLINV